MYSQTIIYILKFLFIAYNNIVYIFYIWVYT